MTVGAHRPQILDGVDAVVGDACHFVQRNDVVNVHEAAAELAIAFLEVEIAHLAAVPEVLQASCTSRVAAFVAQDFGVRDCALRHRVAFESLYPSLVTRECRDGRSDQTDRGTTYSNLTYGDSGFLPYPFSDIGIQGGYVDPSVEPFDRDSMQRSRFLGGVELILAPYRPDRDVLIIAAVIQGHNDDVSWLDLGSEPPQLPGMVADLVAVALQSGSEHIDAVFEFVNVRVGIEIRKLIPCKGHNAVPQIVLDVLAILPSANDPGFGTAQPSTFRGHANHFLSAR